MTSSLWRVENHLARLQIGPLQAILDLLNPAAGLSDWRGLGDALRAVHVLGIEAPSFPAGSQKVRGEAYVRGPDLMASFAESSDWPVCLHGQWKVPSGAEPPEVLAVVELIVSVRTELLDSRPELRVCSALAGGEVFRLADSDAAAFEPWGLAGTAAGRTLSAEGPGCLLFRPQSADVSYAEMVHPADFAGSELTQAEAPGGQVEIRHRLFVQRLEKGVLLRARVRGMFVAREKDAPLAAIQYRRFAGSEPVLGT